MIGQRAQPLLHTFLHRTSHISSHLSKTAFTATTTPLPKKRDQTNTNPNTRNMSSGNPSTLPTTGLSEAIAHRHSVYALKSSVPSELTDSIIEGLIKDTLHNIPSAFNSQTTRVVLAVKEEHRKFWTKLEEVFKNKLDPETFDKMSGRFPGFKGAYGTVLFFEDNVTVKKWQESQPRYANLFPQWSEHTSGAHQIALWTALETFKGVGANLQHYNFDPDVKKMATENFGIPEEWDLKAQLVFGETDPSQFPGAKDKLPTSETLKVFGV